MMNEQEWKKAGIDYQDGLRRMVGNEELYQKFLTKFPDDGSYAGLVSSLEEGRLEDAKSCIHTLKGNAGTLGLFLLADACKKEEAKLKNGAREIDMEELSGYYTAAVEAIKTLI